MAVTPDQVGARATSAGAGAGSTGAGGAGTRGAGAEGEKGLRGGALGLLSSTVVGVASTAPGYSLAASLVLVVVAVGLQAPLIMLIAFVPMVLIAYAFKALNEVDPDCGTTFTWSTRAFGPWVGWMGGWGVIAADVIVMANLAQVAGQYTFRLFNADGLAASRGWVTVVGVLWILLMTAICWRGIELSARTQVVLLGTELVMLVVFAVVALVKVYGSAPPTGSLRPALSWFNPGQLPSFSALSAGVLVAIFIYWGWDTAVSINEETRDKEHTPGRAALLSTLLLLLTYLVVTTAAQAFAGVGTAGNGLGNPDHSADSLSILGREVFGGSGVGGVLSHLLILAILTSAAASTQTTILPAARSSLSMAVWKAFPRRFAAVDVRTQTPAFATWVMGIVSVLFYAGLTFVHGGTPLQDLISAIGLVIAFYYGLTGLASVWFFRKAMRTPRQVLERGVLPGLGGLMLLAFFVRAAITYAAADYGKTSFHGVGGVLVLGLGALAVGVVLMVAQFAVSPGFFRRSQSELVRSAYDAPLTPALPPPSGGVMGTGGSSGVL